MAEKGEVVEISVAVRLTEDCPDEEVTNKATYARLDAQTQLLGIPGAKRYMSGISIRRGLRRFHTRRASHGERGEHRRKPEPEPEIGGGGKLQ